jgi:CheY-like chemotaxis protein
LLTAELKSKPHLQIVAEVEDGLQAVQKAGELQPGLILLDLGLPKLNGIEAARKIGDLSPQSKIIVVTQEATPEMAQATLNLGALGYVVKTDAGRELLPAIDAVLRGERYLSRTVSSATASMRTSELTSHRRSSQQQALFSSPHQVLFYRDDRSLVTTAAGFLVPAIKAGDSALVLLTRSNREALLYRMRADGLDPDALSEEGRYISLDAAQFLSTFMANGFPDRNRFMTVAANIVSKATKKPFGANHNCIATCGECAPLLWSQGNARAAIRLEQLWSELGRKTKMHTLCAYPIGSFQGEPGEEIFERICGEHTSVYTR